jgi:iron complex transport system ATP-binding protein
MHDLNLASRFSDNILLLKKGEIYASGKPDQVITASNIKEVYGVDCIVSNSALGKPQITPIESEIYLKQLNVNTILTAV